MFFIANALAQTVPTILTQPQSQAIVVGSNATFSVTVGGGGPTELPVISSGTLQLWLKADAGVVANGAGQVSQWQDQSGNANHAAQANTNLQPMLVSAVGLGGLPVVRFNGIQNNINGSYLHGVGAVGVPNAMTAFTVYNAFSTTNAENVLWDIGVPGQIGVNRGDDITAGNLRFTFWGYDYSVPFPVPTNTYRIRTDRLDTNLDTLNVFDATAASGTNFTVSVTGAATPGAGYYVGGLDSSQPDVGSSRNFDGDIAEWICYQGYLTESDRLAVVNYLEEKYYEGGGPAGELSYQWQFDGTNMDGATNASLALTDVQMPEAGTYTVTVSNSAGSITSSIATLAVGYSPSISAQPQSQEISQGSDVSFTVGVSGTGPLGYQWSFDGAPVPQATNLTLSLTNIQPTNSGSYSVVVSSPFGSVLSSNAVLTVDPLPVIVTQPQSQVIVVGSNATFSVTVVGGGPAVLPVIGSGTLQLWLKADAGVVTNGAGQVSQWQDQSGNANHASQANTNLQPSLVSAVGLGGKPAVRFNGIQNNINGSYLHGTGAVGVPNAMTSFTVYNAFSTTNNENAVWDIGVPGQGGVNRGEDITAGNLRFTFWGYDYSVPFPVPTNTYRIRTDRLDTNLDTLNVFDATAASGTNFTVSVTGAGTPGAGYYVGGLDSSQPLVGGRKTKFFDLAFSSRFFVA